MSQLAVATVRRPRLRTALLGSIAAAAVLVAPAVGPQRTAALTTSSGSLATASPSSSGSSSASTTSTGNSAGDGSARS